MDPILLKDLSPLTKTPGSNILLYLEKHFLERADVGHQVHSVQASEISNPFKMLVKPKTFPFSKQDRLAAVSCSQSGRAKNKRQTYLLNVHSLLEILSSLL